MAYSKKKHPVVYIKHEDGNDVYCWTTKQGLRTVDACLREHPEEPISVQILRMTEKQYDELPDYKGEC